MGKVKNKGCSQCHFCSFGGDCLKFYQISYHWCFGKKKIYYSGSQLNQRLTCRSYYDGLNIIKIIKIKLGLLSEEVIPSD